MQTKIFKVMRNKKFSYLRVMVERYTGEIYCNPLKLSEAWLIPTILKDNKSITVTLVNTDREVYQIYFGK